MTFDVFLGETAIELNSRLGDENANTLIADVGRIRTGLHTVRVKHGKWFSREYKTRFSSISFRDGFVNAIELNPQIEYASSRNAKKIFLNEVEDLRKQSFYLERYQDDIVETVQKIEVDGGELRLKHEPVLASLHFKRISGIPNSDSSLAGEEACVLVELRFALEE